MCCVDQANGNMGYILLMKGIFDVFLSWRNIILFIDFFVIKTSLASPSKSTVNLSYPKTWSICPNMGEGHAGKIQASTASKYWGIDDGKEGVAAGQGALGI